MITVARDRGRHSGGNPALAEVSVSYSGGGIVGGWIGVGDSSTAVAFG